MTTTRDYYEILGVPRTASADELKRAFYKLARQYHPDVNKEPDAAAKFKEINEAYQVLSDADKRAMYDRFGQAGVNNAAGGGDPGFSDIPFNDIFESLFGAGFGARPRSRRGPQPGAHLKIALTLEFEEAVFGADKEISVPRLETCPSCKGSGAEPGTTPTRCPQCRGTGEVRRATQSIFGQFINVAPCPRCNGEGEIISTPCHECGGQKRVQVMRKLVVKVPPGVDGGTQIRLQGEGEAGTGGGPNGHLYVQIAIKPHPKFKRDNQDLLYELPLNFAQAALGAEIAVPTLEGGDELLKIPAGTQNGKTFRIKGKGVPNLKRSGRGDLIVTAMIAVPTHLSEKQKALLREFARTLEDTPPSEDKGFFEQIKDAIMGS
ncbi:MAG: Chaperone protein DnaJ [Anaerolineae bacterium]|nr:Chaperone protein DnaJ [Anaerolineae bacterium]RIK20494.1 MAG: molecular chaperone DnaJ [Chloroflexota bacterium]